MRRATLRSSLRSRRTFGPRVRYDRGDGFSRRAAGACRSPARSRALARGARLRALRRRARRAGGRARDRVRRRANGRTRHGSDRRGRRALRGTQRRRAAGGSGIRHRRFAARRLDPRGGAASGTVRERCEPFGACGGRGGTARARCSRAPALRRKRSRGAARVLFADSRQPAQSAGRTRADAPAARRTRARTRRPP